MKILWISILTGSAAGLLLVLMKSNLMRVMGYLLMNAFIGTILLYVLNTVKIFEDFQVAVNMYTIIMVGILGMPGLLTMVGLKLMLFS
jgi:inhibitor of the pro-sigma K processing machinery